MPKPFGWCVTTQLSDRDAPRSAPANESSGGVSNEPAPMELAPVGRISALPRGIRQLPFLCQVSRHARHSMGKLLSICYRHGGLRGRLEASLWTTAAVSRENRGANSDLSQPRRSGVFLLHRLLYDEAIAGVDWSASCGPEGPRICAAGYEQQSSFTVQPTFQTTLEPAIASKGSSSCFLSRVLVTVLQLRVTEYREKPHRN